MTPRRFSNIEPLESRIAPATLANPLPDITAGSGAVGATVDLSHMLDTSVQNPNHMHVVFTTNFDMDTNTTGLQAGVIELELFNDVAPLTVQTFLNYVVKHAYDGTFFHRSFDFGSGSGSGIDIIQGGGFSTSDIRTHIPTDLEVHNEFGLPNSAGTIAMAKTALSPNTATSEWFFNVTDNTDILGSANNGGFTVFGKVVSGLDVITKIAQASKTNQGGALTDLPVQPGYNNDPDNNPSTPPPAVTASNLITLTKVEVKPGVTGDITGQVFEVVSVLDSTTNSPSDLLTATLESASKLKLTYDTTKSGTAKVKVRVTKDGESVEDEFNVTLKPNLVANLTSDSLPSLIGPGDSGIVKVRIGNNGATKLTTKVDVKLYLSKIDSSDSLGTVFDSGDVLIGQLLNQNLTLDGGANQVLSTNISFPANQLLESVELANQYRIIAKVSTSSGTTAPTQYFTDDDNAIDGSIHRAANLFGTFSDGTTSHKNLVLTFTETDGDVVTYSMKGPGYAEIQKLGSQIDIHANGTTLASTLVGKTANGDDLTIQRFESISQIGSVSLPQAKISGLVAFPQGVKSITLGDVSGDSKIVIGAFPPNNTQAVTIKLGKVHDVDLSSLMPIGSLSAVEWLDTLGLDDTISAPSIAKLQITGGDLQANVSVTSSSGISSLIVSGVVKDATISTGGTIGSVKAAKLDHVTISAATGVKNLTVNEVAGGSTFSLGTAGSIFASKATLSLGKVSDLVVTAAQPIASLTALEWLDTDAVNDSITAGVLSKLQISGRKAKPGVTSLAGDFAADLTLTDATAPTTLSVAGTVSSAIHAAGVITSAKFGSMVSAELFSGVTTMPTSLADIGFGSLKNLVVIGSFTSSKVAASDIGTLSIGSSMNLSGSVIADAIKSYVRTGGAKLTKLDAPGTFDTAANYAVTIV